MIKNLNYEIRGFKKPAIVFLHGWGLNGDSFNKVIENIPEDQMMIKLDFFSFGKSDCVEEYFDTYEYAYHVFLLLKKLELDEIVLVGHSFGGRVSLILMSVFDIKVHSAILTSSAGLNRFSLTKYLKIKFYKLTKFLVNKKILPSKVLNKFGSDDYKNLDNHLRVVFVRIVNQDLKFLLGKIKNGVVLVWDKKDDITPYWICKKLHNSLINSNIFIFNNGKHFTFLYNIKKFSNIIQLSTLYK